MSATEAILLTFAVIVGIILMLIFGEWIVGLLIFAGAIVVVLLVVAGVVGGIIMMVRAVTTNDVPLGVGGAVMTCVCVILLYLGWIIFGFADR